MTEWISVYVHFRRFPNRFDIKCRCAPYCVLCFCIECLLKCVLTMRTHVFIVHQHALSFYGQIQRDSHRYSHTHTFTHKQSVNTVQNSATAQHWVVANSGNRCNDHDDGVTLATALLCTWLAGFWYAFGFAVFRTKHNGYFVDAVIFVATFRFTLSLTNFTWVFFLLLLLLFLFWQSFFFSWLIHQFVGNFCVMLIKSQDIL